MDVFLFVPCCGYDGDAVLGHGFGSVVVCWLVWFCFLLMFVRMLVPVLSSGGSPMRSVVVAMSLTRSANVRAVSTGAPMLVRRNTYAASCMPKPANVMGTYMKTAVRGPMKSRSWKVGCVRPMACASM